MTLSACSCSFFSPVIILYTLQEGPCVHIVGLRQRGWFVWGLFGVGGVLAGDFALGIAALRAAVRAAVAEGPAPVVLPREEEESQMGQERREIGAGTWAGSFPSGSMKRRKTFVER